MFELSTLHEMKQKLIMQSSQWKEANLQHENEELSSQLELITKQQQKEKESYSHTIDEIVNELNSLKQKHSKTMDIIESLKKENEQLRTEVNQALMQTKSLEAKLDSNNKMHTYELEKLKLKQEQEKYIMNKLNMN